MDRAHATYPMVELQGEQNKYSCCASNRDRRKREKKEAFPNIPLDAQESQVSNHSVLEVREGREVIEYRDEGR